MPDIVYQPGQPVPAGNYIVILRPVDEEETPIPAEVPTVAPVGPPEQNQRTNNSSNNSGVSLLENIPPASVGMTGGRKKGKGKKAKGTRKLSPYMRFAQEARKNILAEDPSLKSNIIAVGKRIGEKWRALSDAEKARY